MSARPRPKEFSQRAARAAKRRSRGAINATSRRIRRTAATPPPPFDLTGGVDVFDAHEAVGWVSAAGAASPIRVALHLNGVQVAATWSQRPAHPGAGGASAAEFRIPLSDLWKYCKRADRLTVQVADTVLPIAGAESHLSPECDGPSNLRQLQRRLDEGFVFGRTGRLQLSKRLDKVWQGAVLSLYERVNAVVHDRHDHELFAIYGTLLGMVREGGFIGHDNDFDSAFISRHSDGRAAAAETRDIALTLVDAGFDVECRRTALHIHDQRNPAIRIDLFHLYFDDHGDLAFPYGIAGTSTYTTADWRGLAQRRVGRHALCVPRDPEQLVEYIYGSSWRTPLPGFRWDCARTGWRKDGWIPVDFEDAVYWANQYAHGGRGESVEPSGLCEFVLPRTEVPRTVVDLGCGDGRDSLAFARAGWTVLGLDSATSAVDHARRRARAAGLDRQAQFVPGDLADPDAVRALAERARESAGGGPLLFHLAHVLQAISPKRQQALLGALAEASRPGDMVAAQFPVGADALTMKTPVRNYRGAATGFPFGAALREQCGYVLLHEEQSNGLTQFYGADAVVYRVLAARS
jgi:hypothetical protein